jgi:hypothetical protein
MGLASDYESVLLVYSGAIASAINVAFVASAVKKAGEEKSLSL